MTPTRSPPPGAPAAAPSARHALGWLRLFAVAGLVGLIAGGVVASCAVPDLEYCTVSAQCPTVETDLGSVQLTCHATRHVCVGGGGVDGCSSDSDCTDYRAPRCDDSTCKRCTVGDTTDKSCAQRADGRKICANATDGSGTLCVACQSNADCKNPLRPICDNQVCRPCATHQDCEGPVTCDGGLVCTDSLVCIQAGDMTGDTLVGSCAQNGPGSTTGKVIYVNSAVPDPDGKTNAGTDLTTAVNNLHRAMDLAHDGSRRYIRLMGTLKDAPGIENNYVIKDSAVSFIGAPVKSSANPAMASVEGRATMFQVMSVGSSVGSLTFDQVTFMQLNANQNSVTCTGSQPNIPTLIIRNSIFKGSTDPSMPMAYTPAIQVTSCNTLLDGNIIGVTSSDDLVPTAKVVHGTALAFYDTATGGVPFSVLVQNNIIAGNAGSGLNLLSTGMGRGKFVFRFNTIVYNGRGQMGTATAIYCSGVPSTMEFSSSIVFGNSLQGGTTQFTQGPNCNFKDVVVGSAEKGTGLGGIILKDPELAKDFRLRTRSAANTDCCIDKVTSPDGLPKTDVDGVGRPVAAQWDIGASEYKP